ncbi:MAG: mechanosensitive ion channel family protein [Candidatus Limnocylindrales bacterium]
MASPTPSPVLPGTSLDLSADDLVRWLREGAPPLGSIVLVVVVAFITIRLARLSVHGLVKALMDREATEGTAQELSALELKKRMDTLETLGGNVLQFFLVIIAAIMILGQLKLDVGPAIAGLGVVGIAVGFGAQSLVKDYLGGALILIENQFGKGDVVRIAGVSGMVEDFSLRRTTLRDDDGTVHTVPNGQIAVASNLTRVWARVNLAIQVVYGTDTTVAAEVVDRVGRDLASDSDWRRRILEPPRLQRVDALGEFGITLKVQSTVRASEQWAVAGELRKRLLDAFQEAGIEIPRPQRVILTRAPSPAGAGAIAGAVEGLAGAEAAEAPSAPTEEELAKGAD